jgi:hypothetical protein
MKTGSTDRAGRNGSALGKWIAERPDVGCGLGEYCEGQLDKESLCSTRTNGFHRRNVTEGKDCGRDLH